MKRIRFLLALLHFSLLAYTSTAAVPLRWTVETSRLKPVVFDVVRGETLALEATFNSYGTPVSTSNQTTFLCWQTNGMANAWWTTNAVTSGNSASVLFTPSMDPGAPAVNAFIGLSSTNVSNISNSNIQTFPSLSYRAAFTLRFRHGPGETPNALPLPTPTIDCEKVTFLHPESAPFGGGGGGGGVDTNAVKDISRDVIREDVRTNYLCTVSAAQGMASSLTTNGISFYNQDGWKYAEFKNNGFVKFGWFGENRSVVEIIGSNGMTLFPSWDKVCIFTGEDTQTLPDYISSASVTNGGAKAYADEKFLEKSPDYYHKIYWDGHALNIGASYVYFGSSIAEFGAGVKLPSPSRIELDYIYPTLPAYLASTEWHGSDKSLADYGITNNVPSVDYTTNNTVLVSTITNLAPTRALGLVLHDSVRQCDWYPVVTNGVFYWLIED